MGLDTRQHWWWAELTQEWLVVRSGPLETRWHKKERRSELEQGSAPHPHLIETQRAQLAKTLGKRAHTQAQRSGALVCVHVT